MLNSALPEFLSCCFGLTFSGPLPVWSAFPRSAAGQPYSGGATRPPDYHTPVAKRGRRTTITPLAEFINRVLDVAEKGKAKAIVNNVIVRRTHTDRKETRGVLAVPVGWEGS